MNLQVVSKCYSFVGKGSQPNHIDVLSSLASSLASLPYVFYELETQNYLLKCIIFSMPLGPCFAISSVWSTLCPLLTYLFGLIQLMLTLLERLLWN